MGVGVVSLVEKNARLVVLGRRLVGVFVLVAASFLVVSCVVSVPPSFSSSDRAESGASSEVGMSVVHQEGAPFPADVEYLEDILAIPPGNTLPVGAEVVSVEPAVKFAEYYEGGWGYVIAFTAEEQAILDYVRDKTGLGKYGIDEHPVVTNEFGSLDDFPESIEKPWMSGVSMNAELLLERPLGRGWLLIRGAPR